MTSPATSAFTSAQKNVGVISRPLSSPVAWLRPPVCWKRTTRKPSNPASRSALRYSVTYIPKRQGPQAPAVKNTYFLTISLDDRPCLSRRVQRYFTRLPTVKYVGLHWPRLPNSLPYWSAALVGHSSIWTL